MLPSMRDEVNLMPYLNNQIIDELVEFTKLPKKEVINRMLTGVERNRDAFNKVNPKTDQEVENFYRTNEEYLWDLACWHSMDDKSAENQKLADVCSFLHPNAKTVIDYGCGIGQNGLIFAKCGYDVTLVDFDTVCFKFAKWRADKYSKTVNLVTMDDLRRSLTKKHSVFKNRYDVVLCFDVLEHLTVSQLRQVTEELLTLKSPGGKIIYQASFGWGVDTGSHPMHFKMDDERKPIMDAFIKKLCEVE